MRTFAVGARSGACRVEVPGAAAGGLDGGVDCLDVLAGGSGDRDAPALGGGVEPEPGDTPEMIIEGTGLDPSVFEVRVEGPHAAVSQQAGRGGFPRRAEPVDTGQLMRSSGGAEFVERTAASDGLELAWVTGEDEPPRPLFGERDQPIEGAGANHPDLINQECGPSSQPVAGVGWPVGSFPFVEELGAGPARQSCCSIGAHSPRSVAVIDHEAIDDLANAYLGHRDNLEQVRRGDLARRLADGDVIVIDVHPGAEYAAGSHRRRHVDPYRAVRPDLTQIVFARAIARRAYRTVKENLFVGVGVVHVLDISAVLIGLIGPVQAAILHLGPDVLVFLNSTKLFRVHIGTGPAAPHAAAANAT